MKVSDYFATVLDGMAKGLFATLIIGVIVKQIGVLAGISLLEQTGQVAQYCMGAGIGVGIALKRNAKTYTLLAAIAAGMFGSGAVYFSAGVWAIKTGEPASAFIAALAAIEIASLIEGKTKLDLLIVPAVVIAIGGLVGVYVSPYIADALNYVGKFIIILTDAQAIPMGILLGVVVGMVLTAPISSAAICIAVGIGGIGPDASSVAAGAALAGCCAQMVGFAVISYRENKIGGLLAQGLGTSMLQVPNIIRNPLIWIPPTVASGVCGLVSAAVFEARTTSVGAGMGTSGLVGPMQTYQSMGNDAWLVIIIVHLILPVVISLPIAEFMRKKGLIKEGDLKIG